MSDSIVEIYNLLYRYVDAIDTARFDDAAMLFDHGAVVAGGKRIEGRQAIAALWRSWVRLYPDGMPHTRHLVTNPLVELDNDGARARCHSQWTLLQATTAFPLQVVATGRYDDRFIRVDGHWHFAERIYLGVDLVGDTSAHMLLPLGGNQNG
ncbi:MAG: nuclear transport factor 2 family protein [Rhodanobacter sp.]|nr:MAG: nuclear transport factor 2 family protein [Rhodanobacter sp.]